MRARTDLCGGCYAIGTLPRPVQLTPRAAIHEGKLEDTRARPSVSTVRSSLQKRA